MKGKRSEFPGTYRMRGGRWGMKVYLDGELHYLGTMADRQAAADYVRLVESRYPDRLRRPRGTVARHKGRWQVFGPRPERRYLGTFFTRARAEMELKRRGIR